MRMKAKKCAPNPTSFQAHATLRTIQSPQPVRGRLTTSNSIVERADSVNYAIVEMKESCIVSSLRGATAIIKVSSAVEGWVWGLSQHTHQWLCERHPNRRTSLVVVFALLFDTRETWNLPMILTGLIVVQLKHREEEQKEEKHKGGSIRFKAFHLDGISIDERIRKTGSLLLLLMMKFCWSVWVVEVPRIQADRVELVGSTNTRHYILRTHFDICPTHLIPIPILGCSHWVTDLSPRPVWQQQWINQHALLVSYFSTLISRFFRYVSFFSLFPTFLTDHLTRHNHCPVSPSNIVLEQATLLLPW